jgi:hypothetical protein
VLVCAEAVSWRRVAEAGEPMTRDVITLGDVRAPSVEILCEEGSASELRVA